MSKHTPGPWVHDGNCGVFDEKRRDSVCTTDYSCHEEDLANADLIAAAPDLLEALSILESTCDAGLPFDHPIRAYVRNEIAKAKGEKQ